MDDTDRDLRTARVAAKASETNAASMTQYCEDAFMRSKMQRGQRTREDGCGLRSFRSGNVTHQRGRAKDLQAYQNAYHPSSVACDGYPPALVVTRLDRRSRSQQTIHVMNATIATGKRTVVISIEYRIFDARSSGVGVELPDAIELNA